jgi:DnaD/phage-associated family protein
MFAIYNDAMNDSTLVSNLFIDEYMKDANDAQLKIYLYLLRCMSSGRGAGIQEMADIFNHTEREVMRSLRYWEKKGLLNLEFDGAKNLTAVRISDLRDLEETRTSSAPAPGRVISIAPRLTPPQEEEAGEGSEKKEASAAPAKRKKHSSDAVTAFMGSGERAQLLFIVEQYIGKPLSVNEIEVIYYISEDLRFSDDLIDYLLQYCVDRGKKDFRYIEKVALNWAEKGVTTAKQAERVVSGAAKTRSSAPRQKASSNRFNQFEQHQYDFDALEKILNS